MREPTIAWALRTKQAHQIHDLVSKQSRKHAGFHSVLLRQAFFDSSKSPLQRTSATRQYCNAMHFSNVQKEKLLHNVAPAWPTSKTRVECLSENEAAEAHATRAPTHWF